MLALGRGAGTRADRWVLSRHGDGRERRWVSNQFRLAKDGSHLYIGKGVPGSQGVYAALGEWLSFEDYGDQWFAALSPVAPESAAALEQLSRIVKQA
jgi:hypothetical protein